MSELRLETLDHATAFRPGDVIEGIAGWDRPDPPRHAEVRLIWHTAGKGDRDVAIVDTVAFENPAAVDAQVFRFTAPDGPYSFSGTLVSLVWSLELIVEPGGGNERLDLTLSPSGEEIDLSTTGAEAEA